MDDAGGEKNLETNCFQTKLTDLFDFGALFPFYGRLVGS